MVMQAHLLNDQERTATWSRGSDVTSICRPTPFLS